MEHIVQAVTIRWYNACAYYAVALAQGLRALGRRVTVVGGYGTPAPDRARRAGCDVADFEVSSSRGPLALARTVAAYRRFAREQGVTLVDAHNGHDHLLWTLALRGTGVPVVRTSGNQIPPNIHPASRFLMRSTAGTIVSCRTVRDFYIGGFGIPKASIPVINGGVDCKFYHPGAGGGLSRSDVGIPEDAFVFGILARFSPDKGHDVFFRAAGLTARRYPEARFLVAGWKAQFSEDDISAMAAEAGIADRCVFAGRHDDTRDLIGIVDCGVVTSVGSETICRIAMEYMAMGVPVIGSDTNVVPEVVRHERTGLVVPAHDHEALAAAMDTMVCSRDTVRAYGKTARVVAESDYSLTAFAEKTLHAYGEFTVI